MQTSSFRLFAEFCCCLRARVSQRTVYAAEFIGCVHGIRKVSWLPPAYKTIVFQDQWVGCLPANDMHVLVSDMSNPLSTMSFIHRRVGMAVSRTRKHVSSNPKVGARYLDPYDENFFLSTSDPY